MWVGLASFAMMFMALWLSEFTLAAVGFTLLLIARWLAITFIAKGRAVNTVFDARSVASPRIYSKL
jgi:hypothetical protein